MGDPPQGERQRVRGDGRRVEAPALFKAEPPVYSSVGGKASSACESVSRRVISQKG